jgi:hypothetical protein
MIYNLTKTEDFLFVLDNSEIKEGVWYFLPRTQSPHFCGSKESEEELNLERDFGVRKILAHIPINRPEQTLYGLPTLPTLPENHDDSIDDMAREFYWKRNPNKDLAENSRPDMVIGFVGGYNKSREKYKFTEEDLKASFAHCARYAANCMMTDKEVDFYGEWENYLKNIQSIQQIKFPIAFECEFYDIQVKNINTHELIKGRMKTVTNSEGRTEWVGKYIYE